MKGTYDFNTAASTSTGSDSSELIWFGQAVPLKDFSDEHPTPNMAKIVHGEYMNLGPHKANTPKEDGKENEILIHSIETTTKALAVNMRVKEGRGVSETENKLSIPLSYEGWFEVLSEDGRRVKPIESIKDLVRIFPHTCLVRRSIQAYVPLADGSVKHDTLRTVQVGETLTLFGIMKLTLITPTGSEEVVFLRCLDAQGSSVFFKHDQIGQFSPVAGKENISGVHTIKGILTKFHMPVTCKLVHGNYPKNVDRGKFSGILRIVYVYDEQTAFVCPASGQYRMMPISTEIPLKVVPAVNFDDIKSSEIINRVLTRCSSMVKCYLNTIHLLYDVDVLPPPKSDMVAPTTITPKLAEVEEKEKDPKRDELYDEIEDIYFYVVRHGVNPPAVPKKMFKEGEMDNDHWEQPIYKTLHKPKRRRQSLANGLPTHPAANGARPDNNTKVFRFYHNEALNGDCRPLAYVSTEVNRVDRAMEIHPKAGGPPPVPPRLITRCESDADILDKKGEKKERRKSQPAIFRFIFRVKDKAKDGSGSSEGSAEKGAGSDDRRRRGESRAREKLKHLYL